MKLKGCHESYRVPFKYMRFTERQSYLQTAVFRKLNQIRCLIKGDSSTIQQLKNSVSSNREKYCFIPGKGRSLTDPKRWVKEQVSQPRHKRSASKSHAETKEEYFSERTGHCGKDLGILSWRLQASVCLKSHGKSTCKRDSGQGTRSQGEKPWRQEDHAKKAFLWV